MRGEEDAGPWTPVEAYVVRGRTITSWPSLKTDLKNAGAEWVDREVVVDDGLVSSRKPEDLPAFNRKMIEEFGKGPQHNRSRCGIGHQVAYCATFAGSSLGEGRRVAQRTAIANDSSVF
jgi:hypothetical protein